MTLHADEVPITEDDARRLMRTQAPQWADLPLRAGGHGTDNVILRLGDDLLLRLPRRPSTAEDVAKEQTWLPYLAAQLPLEIPEPVFEGAPDDGYPFAWSIYRWIDGAEPSDDTIDDWSGFGADLAAFVTALHTIDLHGATRQGSLAWYRGERLSTFAEDGHQAIDELDTLSCTEPLDLDLAAVRRLWDQCTSTPEPDVPPGWLHGDLRSANLVARDGRLAGVIDFGCLGVGRPAAEHAAIWAQPRAARDAYRARLGLDGDAWTLARGWSLLPNLIGISYYWNSWPEFAKDSLRQVRLLVGTPD